MWVGILTTCSFGQQTDAYEYPITGGLEWSKLVGPDFDHRFEACEVPEDILLNMSTEGLIETCLSYPPNYMTWAGNNQYETYLRITKRSNAYRELFNFADNRRIEHYGPITAHAGATPPTDPA